MPKLQRYEKIPRVKTKDFFEKGLGKRCDVSFPSLLLLSLPMVVVGVGSYFSAQYTVRGASLGPHGELPVCALKMGNAGTWWLTWTWESWHSLLSASRPSGHCIPLWRRVRGVPGAITHVTFGRKRQPWVFCKEILTKREGPWTNGFLVRGSGDWSWGCQGQPCEGQLLPIITGVAVCKTQQGNLGRTHQSTCERKSPLQASARFGG